MPSSPPEPIGPALEQIDSILALNPAERGALDVAMSRRRELTGSALYFMLDKASRLPPLAGEDLNALDRPSYHNLVRWPQRYAGRPIRMRVLVQLVQKQTAGAPGELGIDRTHWRQGRVAWLIDGFDADGELAIQRPVRIFSVADPTPILPKPVKIVNDNEWHYPQTLVEVDLAGVFYKVWEHEERGTEDTTRRRQPGDIQIKQFRSYPIVIAWQLNPVGVSRTRQPHAFVAMDFIGFIVIGLVFMVVVFFLLARHVRRTRRAGRNGSPFWEGKYRSLRDEEEDDDQAPDDNDLDIDPALKAAADNYRRQHGQDQPNG
ncbi:MAG: hypothetical protein ACYS8X_00675 [Planctomycetota bacterium]